MTNNSKERKKKIWQFVLAAGIILELVLINFYVVARLNGIDLPQWQLYLFVGIAIWIYIAFLKQRSVEISKTVVDEKIKTHALADYLREGILVLDEDGGVMMVNRKAAAVLGVDELDMLERKLVDMIEGDEQGLLGGDRNGEADMRFVPGDRMIHFSVIVLPGDAERQRGTIVYVRNVEPAKPISCEHISEETSKRRVDHAFEILNRWIESRSTCSDELRLMQVFMHLQDAHDIIARQKGDVGEQEETVFRTDEIIGQVLTRLQPAVNQLGSEVDTIFNAETFRLRCEHEGAVSLLLMLVGSGLCAAGKGGALKIQSAAMGSLTGIAISDSGGNVEDGGQLFAEETPFVMLPNNDLRCSLSDIRFMIEKSGGSLTVDMPPEGGMRITVMVPA